MARSGVPGFNVTKTVTAGWAILLLSALCISSQALFGQAKSEAQLHAERGLQLMQAGDLHAAEGELRQAVKLSPRDPTHLAELGVVLGMEQKLADSDRYFQEALRIDPDNVAIRRNLAKNQWRLGEFERAEANLQRVLKAQPGDNESTLILGMLEENLKHFAGAVRLLNSVPALVTQRPEAVVALARSYYQIKNPSGARQALRSLLQDNAPSEALYLGGQTALEGEDFATAEELFIAAKPGYPDRAKLGYFLAFSRYRAGKFRDCQDTVLDTFAAGPPTRDLYALLGWCYAHQEKIRESTEAFDQAVALDPANETTYLDLGTVLLDHRQDELALALGKETATKFPNSYRALMLRGMAEADLGYLTDAVKSFGRAVELNPGSPEANYDLAIIQSIAGFANDALRTLQRGIKRFPRDAPHYQEYASLEIQQAEGGDAGAEARAYEALRKALSLDSSLAKPHLLLGRLELKNNRVEQAVRELETAAKLDPHDGAIHLALSRAYARLGVPDKAAKELATYRDSAQAELQGGRGRTPVALRRW
jgi:tetratricopeptide (TPR) repeat protein